MTTASRPPVSPAEFDALVALAKRECNAGRLAEAAAAYHKILAIRPDIAEAYNDFGNLLVRQGKLEPARSRFEQALALRPDYAEAHNNLGVILNLLGRFDEAVAHYEQALALKPAYVEAHNNLGLVLGNQGKLDQAVARYEQALALKPDCVEAHYNLGNTLRDQGKLDQAVARYRQALALKPNHVDAHNNLGITLKYQGAFDEAVSQFGQALTLMPDFAEAHFSRADLKTFRPGDVDLAALKGLAADPARLPPSKMLYIHFALGKALEDVGDYARAFEQLVKGNALKRREIDYDEAGWQRAFQLIAQVFDAGLFEQLGAVGDPSPAPIFVIGIPRSGGTLIEQILASHPQVHGAGELVNLSLLANRATSLDGRHVSYPACVTTFGADDFRRLGESYLASLPTPDGGKDRITDKMPANFLYVGLIRLILPNARIIHATRDPVDTCVSCFARLFASGQPFSYDLGELGRYYRRYSELMAHWRSVLPAGAMLEVSYENVVDNLEAQARRLIDYCGLPWDDRCLSFHQTRRPIRTASNVQVRRPLYRSSLGRWRRFEPYLQPLLVELAGCDQPD